MYIVYEFRQRIADTYQIDESRQHQVDAMKDHSHYTQYLAATAFIETCFNDDIANKRWDYLLTWEEDHKKVEETQS